jgi:hypothetical protein
MYCKSVLQNDLYFFWVLTNPGLNPEVRAHVEQAYLQANHGSALRGMRATRRALAVVRAAAEIATKEVQSHVGVNPLGILTTGSRRQTGANHLGNWRRYFAAS